MTFLYTCRHDGDQYRITKLTDGLDVESSYLCTFTECECPAGIKRGHCRHMEMLPKFVQRGAIGTGWMLDFDRGGWVDNRTEEELNEVPPLPDGVQAFSLGDPAALHNAIAEAVGEPEIPEGYPQQAIEAEAEFQELAASAKSAPAPKPSWRRF